jgi:hypothetical protein
MLYYDNASVHNARKVAKRLAEYGFVRLVHLLYSPDLASCDFFLFDDLREQLMQSTYSTPKELEEAIVRTIEDIPMQSLLDVFVSWWKRVKKCIECDGRYFEYRFPNLQKDCEFNHGN